jgi:hypothetical protein
MHPGWLALTLLIAIYGAGVLGDIVWDTLVDRAWWAFPLAVPSLVVLYWLLAGSWRRAQARGRPRVPS